MGLAPGPDPDPVRIDDGKSGRGSVSEFGETGVWNDGLTASIESRVEGGWIQNLGETSLIPYESHQSGSLE